MNINNENYEEYFLLYADNELSAEQRKIVEMFVKANPQLQKDWDELMATIQTPDNISLVDKSFLLKRPVDGFIDTFNYEKRFVEYHDGELSDEERSFVLNFLKDHSELKKEFDLIACSYLTPDTKVLFPNKESLYRKSAIVRYAFFVRMTAAAVILGFIVWFGTSLLQKPVESNNGNIAIVHPTQPKEDVPQINQTKEKSTQQKLSTISEKSQMTGVKIIPDKKDIAVMEPKETEKNISSETNINEINTSSQPTEEITAMIPVTTKVPASELGTSEAITEPALLIPHADIDQTPVKQLPQSNYATMTQGTNENDYVFTDIPAENIQRSKLGIFIKKVKRTIDRNNPINRLLNGEEN